MGRRSGLENAFVRLTSIAGGYPAGLGIVVAWALVLLPLRGTLTPETLMLLSVPPIVVVARIFGIRVSATAAVLASLLSDFLFVAPYYRLSIALASEAVSLAVFLVVALLAGQQTGRLREREQAALRRQRQLELLNRLAFGVALDESVQAVADSVVDGLASTLGVPRVALYASQAALGSDSDSGHSALSIVAERGEFLGAEEERTLAEQAFGEAPPWVAHPIGEGGMSAAYASMMGGAAEAGAAEASRAICLPLCTSDSREGVLCVFGLAEPLDSELIVTLVSVANLTAAAMERERLEEAAVRAGAEREADRLRGVIVSAISHELKTPLAAATARVTGLVDEGAECERARMQEELAEVASDLDRLNSLIGDLIDLSRLESDSWRPNFEPVDIGEVLGTALSRIPSAERNRIRFSLAEDLPPARADFSQLTRAFVAMLENALLYSPPGSEVKVSATGNRGNIEIGIEDHGPGVASSERARIFEKSYRGTAARLVPTGTGLGLTIAKEIVDNHRGQIWVEPMLPRGARFVVCLPAEKVKA
ncbi:MAG: ATP-binding protein [Coriobacteriia bacterium]